MEHPQVTITRQKLEKLLGYWSDVVEQSGVSISWLSKFRNGLITNPGIETLALVDAACDKVLLAKMKMPPKGRPRTAVTIED